MTKLTNIQALISDIRKTLPNQIAEELCSVQPMPNTDFDALAQTQLWKGFVARHFSYLNISDGG